MKNTPPPSDDPWTRLAATARRAPARSPLAGDEDFAARVVARWLHPPPAPAPGSAAFLAPLWEAWSLRGLAAAGALALAVLAFSLPALQEGTGLDALSLDPLDALLADF